MAEGEAFPGPGADAHDKQIVIAGAQPPQDRLLGDGIAADRGAYRDPGAVAELDDLAQDRLLIGADRPRRRDSAVPGAPCGAT